MATGNATAALAHVSLPAPATRVVAVEAMLTAARERKGNMRFPAVIERQRAIN